ncbi:winged helix DNA-binding domain-containing protein [Gordonia sinesedis]
MSASATSGPDSTAARPRITDRQRRARLLRRHRLTADVPSGTGTGTVEDVVRSMVALHATTPSTIYLSAWARLPGFAIDDLDRALYTDRSLVKHLAMRRTLFVMERDVLADAVGALGPRVAASERTNMLRDLRRSDDFADPEGWIDTARNAVRAELAAGEPLTSTQLRQRLPELSAQVIVAAHKSWGGKVSMGPRVLSMMSAAGEIVRGPNRAGWQQSRPVWTLMPSWLGEELPGVAPPVGYRALVRRWLRTFGPGTETDIVWWLGSTKTAVRAALAELAAVAVDLDDGQVGYVLPDDLDELADADLPEPAAALLPELDPTTMGHKVRDFYLGPHAARLFDSAGNGGQTAWWDGRIVGGWYVRDDGSVAIYPMERLDRTARRALDDRAAELTAWLAGARPTIGYAAPFMREIAPAG